MQVNQRDKIKKIQSETPIISDKVLVNLVNSIQVNGDLISFRENQGFFGQFFDNITGADRKREIAIDKNVNIGMQSVHDLLLNLANNLNISNNAIFIVGEKLLEARQALRNHRQEIDLLKDITDRLQARVDNHEHRIRSLEQRVYRLEVQHGIEDAIAAWKSKHTYQGFHWAIQVAFVARQIVDFTLSDYERLIARDVELRQSIINRILAASDDTIPDNSFSLIELLNLSYEKTASENRELAGYLLEVSSISPNRLSKTPYLFTLGKTLELSQPSEKPNNPAKYAVELFGRYPNSLLCTATSKREFVDRIVNETANDRLNSTINYRSEVSS